jgi:hypothetical protein
MLSTCALQSNKPWCVCAATSVSNVLHTASCTAVEELEEPVPQLFQPDPTTAVEQVLDLNMF